MLARPVAIGVLATLAGLKLVSHLATHHRYGYERDELYFIACAKRLAHAASLREAQLRSPSASSLTTTRDD
jgi:hypothetical protein